MTGGNVPTPTGEVRAWQLHPRSRRCSLRVYIALQWPARQLQLVHYMSKRVHTVSHTERGSAMAPTHWRPKLPRLPAPYAHSCFSCLQYNVNGILNWSDENLFQVTVTYTQWNRNLTVAATELIAGGNTRTFYYNVDIFANVGCPPYTQGCLAWMGFTAGTGGSNAQFLVTSFSCELGVRDGWVW